MLFATLCVNDSDQANNSEDMETNPGDSVIDVFAVTLIVIISGCAPVSHDAESEEVSVGAEEQVSVNTRHVVPNELIHYQVDKLSALEAH
jgi:hypothetical protein